VEAGPDRASDGVVRWRCADLRPVIKERFDVDLDEVSIGRVLKELGFAHVSPRPQHPKQDPQAIEAFKKLCNAGSGGDRHKEIASEDPQMPPPATF
jgi:transposase